MARKPTVAASKRLSKEYERLLAEPDPYFSAHWDMDNDDILTWYFVFKGAEKTDYEVGYFMGKIVMSPHYPFKPPSIFMLTPNGRFKTDTRLCLSFSDFHPEEWGAGWPVKSMVLGIQSFMMDESDPSTHGGLYGVPHEERQRLARESIVWNRKNPIYRRYFGDMEHRINAAEAASPPEAKKHKPDEGAM